MVNPLLRVLLLRVVAEAEVAEAEVAKAEAAEAEAAEAAEAARRLRRNQLLPIPLLLLNQTAAAQSEAALFGKFL